MNKDVLLGILDELKMVTDSEITDGSHRLEVVGAAKRDVTNRTYYINWLDGVKAFEGYAVLDFRIDDDLRNNRIASQTLIVPYESIIGIVKRTIDYPNGKVSYFQLVLNDHLVPHL